VRKKRQACFVSLSYSLEPHTGHIPQTLPAALLFITHRKKGSHCPTKVCMLSPPLTLMKRDASQNQ
jgi:hypothetical protein